jgi:hypothetical protein
LTHRWLALLLLAGLGLVLLISGSAARADTVVSDGLQPAGVAVDGSGDVFIADTANNRVVVDKPNGSGGYTQSVVDDTGLHTPEGVAVDGSGDVSTADYDNGRVVVDKPNGSGGYAQSVVSTGLDFPAGVAADASGDVFITDTYHNRVLVEKPNRSSGYTESVVDDTGLSLPYGVAVDASGDVFIADAGNNRVVADKPNGTGGYTQSVVEDTGPLALPNQVAVDGSGDDLFIAEPALHRVVEHSTTDPTAAFTNAESAGSFTVAFTDASNAVSPATITRWSWDFGDESPGSTQQNPSHTYASAGTYNASLTVTDSNGHTSTVTEQVAVARVHGSLRYPTLGQTGVSRSSRSVGPTFPPRRATSCGPARVSAPGVCSSPGCCRRPRRPTRSRRSRPA